MYGVRVSCMYVCEFCMCGNACICVRLCVGSIACYLQWSVGSYDECPLHCVLPHGYGGALCLGGHFLPCPDVPMLF